MITDLNDPNEPFTPSTDSPEIQGMDTFFGNFIVETSTIINPEQQFEIVAYMQPTVSTQWSQAPDKNQIWSLYFDGSKSKEGDGAMMPMPFLTTHRSEGLRQLRIFSSSSARKTLTFLYFPFGKSAHTKIFSRSPLFTYQGIRLRDFANQMVECWFHESLKPDIPINADLFPFPIGISSIAILELAMSNNSLYQLSNLDMPKL
jgi:hypothetical protein